YFREQKQRRQIRSAFGYYLSPYMVEQLARSPEKLVLGGEERRMTILFSDVRGFTTISEHYKDDPQVLTRLMNRFLTPLTNAIIERKGTIDKYIGDAIMAFWNAPVDDEEQEANACEAALEMLSRAETLNSELKREAETNGGTYMPLRIGIGLNTGPCVVGNMGFRFPLQLFGAGRHRELGVAAGRPDRGLPHPRRHRLTHRRRRQAKIRGDGNRLDHGERQEAAGGGVHGAGPLRSRSRSALPAVARSQRADAAGAVGPHRHNRMILPDVGVADDNELDVLRSDAGCLQRHVFGDRVILAIAAMGCECFERGAPAVGDAPLLEVAGRHDRQVDRTIDHANTGTTAARAAFIDNGKETLCYQRTRGCVFAAMRQDLLIFANFRFDAHPFAQNFPLGNAFCRKSERRCLGRRCGLGRNSPPCRCRLGAYAECSNVSVLPR